MFTGDGPRHAKTQADAAALRIAGRIEPIERCKYLFLLLHRNARTVIVDHDDHPPGFSHDVDPGRPAILDGVVDQVGDRTIDHRRPAGDLDAARPQIGSRAAGVCHIFANILDENTEVHQRPGFLSCGVTRKGERRPDHGIHRVQIAEHLALLLLIFDELGPQPQPGQRRSQIMRYRSQHLRSVLQKPP